MVHAKETTYFGRAEYNGAIQYHAFVFYADDNAQPRKKYIFTKRFATLDEADAWFEAQETASGFTHKVGSEDSEKLLAWMLDNHLYVNGE